MAHQQCSTQSRLWFIATLLGWDTRPSRVIPQHFCRVVLIVRIGTRAWVERGTVRI